MKKIVLIAFYLQIILAPALSYAEKLTVNGKEIIYSVRDFKHNEVFDKYNLNIEISLIEGRLPNKDEISMVSKAVIPQYPDAEMKWVFFILPQMKVGAGAYATDHRIPKPEGVKIMEFMLLNSPYSGLVQ